MQNLFKHKRKCDGTVKYKYPGVVYKNTPSVFEELRVFGIVVPDGNRFEKYFAVFDFEACQRDFNKDTCRSRAKRIGRKHNLEQDSRPC